VELHVEHAHVEDVSGRSLETGNNNRDDTFVNMELMSASK